MVTEVRVAYLAGCEYSASSIIFAGILKACWRISHARKTLQHLLILAGVVTSGVVTP